MLEPEIHAGKFYLVEQQGSTYMAVVVKSIRANEQGESGPGKWLVKSICSLNEATFQDGAEFEARATDFIRRGTKQDIVIRCLEQGWREVPDIVNYLEQFGIRVSYGTVAGYKSKWLAAQRNSRASPSASRFRLADFERYREFVHEFGGQERLESFLEILDTMKFGK